MSDTFSLYWIGHGSSNINVEKRRADAEECVESARRLTSMPSVLVVQKVWIVEDKSDTTSFHWEDGKIIFPTREDLEALKR